LKPYFLTRTAAEGLEALIDTVRASFGVEVAWRVLGELERSFQQLADFPGIGHRRSDITSDERVRFWAAPPSLIAYLPRPEGVVILFVERGSRDWSEWELEELP